MKKILIQLDTDEHPSTFDRVVAVDAEVDHLFSYGGVTPDNVTSLVHGAMFTRGPQDLNQTAIFVGGSNTVAGEELFEKVQSLFFGPMRVSVMLDSNGSNTTAAAAVLAAANHLDLSKCNALVLGGTGPVGQRAAELLALEGGRVKLASRSLDKATDLANKLDQKKLTGQIEPVAAAETESVLNAADDVDLIIAAGAAGVQFLSEEGLKQMSSVKVTIDLNAVPPAGLGGIDVMEKANEQEGVTRYGAIGVGGTKMKIHKAAIRGLFADNKTVYDTESLFRLGQGLAK